ncbi:hypothetical protein JCM8202v2_002547 [Rhodotorula sphaerocarpa]
MTGGSWYTKLGPAGDVGRITVLGSMERAKDAQELLHTIAKPVMKLHGWYLPLLAEAFPQQKNLYGYNVNGGKEIHLRLRPPFDDKSFLPLEDSLIPTMLHELTHNHRGPHDEIFFSFLEKLTDELAAYQKHGFFGFAGRGQRLGAGLRAPLGGEDVRAARIKHLQRVERMRKLLEKGGRLGGQGPKRITFATIATAAENRRRAALGCGGDDAHPGGADREHQKPEVIADMDRAAKDSIVIDLTHEADDSDYSDIEVMEEPVRQEGADAQPVASSSHHAGGASKPKTAPKPAPKPEPASAETLASASSSQNKAGRKRSAPSAVDADVEIEIISSDGAQAATSDDEIQIVSIKPAIPRKKPAPNRRFGATALSSPSTSTSNSTANSSPRSRQTRSQTLTNPLIPREWSCPLCGALCDADSTRCTCGLSLPPYQDHMTSALLRAGDGWICEPCLIINSHEFWTCWRCGRVKKSSERG